MTCQYRFICFVFLLTLIYYCQAIEQQTDMKNRNEASQEDKQLDLNLLNKFILKHLAKRLDLNIEFRKQVKNSPKIQLENSKRGHLW